jgi:hypothetical protein
MAEILRVTAEGEFIWHEDADRLIEEYDQDDAPAMKHILKRLRNSVMDVSAAKRIATGLGWEPKGTWGDSEMSRPEVVADQKAMNIALREWVGLAENEIEYLCAKNELIFGRYAVQFIRDIEDKLKEKNNG